MDSNSRLNKDFTSIILLIITTILWGSSFIITKILIKNFPIFLYLGLRYSIALIGFFPFLLRIEKIDKSVIWTGIITGIIFYLAIAFQTLGLKSTSAGKAAFITGLNCIIVPFLVWILFRKKEINIRIWLAVIFSIIGMGFLLLEGDINVILGDILVLICAIFFALFIVFNDKYVQIVDIYLYSIIQLATLMLLCFSSSLLLDESYDLMNTTISFWLIMVYMGIAVTTFTFLFQNWSQKYQSPSKTAIIFTLEPVFAILFASFLIGDENLSIQTLIGCGLIFIAILITVIKNKQFNYKYNDKDIDHMKIKNLF